MFDFTYYNPVRILFGRGTIARLADLMPEKARVLLVYGGGSIKCNGVYDQVAAALSRHRVWEFGGIEPNPLYETCMRAANLARSEGCDFLLAAGGGSVIDAAKFIAAAVPFPGEEPWDMLEKKVPVEEVLPLGCVVTLAATGSEMNANSVISRASTRQKIPFKSEHLFPRFSILDPTATFTLPFRQSANGVVDTFVHVCEQYLTYPVNAPLQDRQAEAILLTLIEEGPKLHTRPDSYDLRANLMWCATQALNHSISCGVPSDWATHAIGHELTALFGLDHARALAVVLPALLAHRRRTKKAKLLQYAQRIWSIDTPEPEKAIDLAIDRTVQFFNGLGVPTRLGDYGLSAADCGEIVERLDRRRPLIGEHQDIGGPEVTAILTLAE
jgi:NADP-dependent alcohol dehydrogenase